MRNGFFHLEFSVNYWKGEGEDQSRSQILICSQWYQHKATCVIFPRSVSSRHSWNHEQCVPGKRRGWKAGQASGWPSEQHEGNTLCAWISPGLTIVLLGPTEDASRLLKHFNITKDARAEVGKGLLIFTRQFLVYFLPIKLFWVLLLLLSICC